MHAVADLERRLWRLIFCAALRGTTVEAAITTFFDFATVERLERIDAPCWLGNLRFRNERADVIDAPKPFRRILIRCSRFQARRTRRGAPIRPRLPVRMRRLRPRPTRRQWRATLSPRWSAVSRTPAGNRRARQSNGQDARPTAWSATRVMPRLRRPKAPPTVPVCRSPPTERARQARPTARRGGRGASAVTGAWRAVSVRRTTTDPLRAPPRWRRERPGGQREHAGPRRERPVGAPRNGTGRTVWTSASALRHRSQATASLSCGFTPPKVYKTARAQSTSGCAKLRAGPVRSHLSIWKTVVRCVFRSREYSSNVPPEIGPHSRHLRSVCRHRRLP